MKNLFAALALASLTACASVPVDVATAPSVPEVRVLDKSFLQPGAGKVPVIVTYDNLQDIGTMSVMFSVDGVLTAEIKEGEKLEGYVAEGRRVLSTHIGPRRAFMTSTPDVFTAGQGPYTYRIHQGVDGKVGLSPS